MPKPVTAFSFEALEMIAARFRVFSEPIRLRILVQLGNLELTVSQVAIRAETSQPNASRQLAVLLDAGLVARRKDQLNVYYRIVDPTVLAMCERVCTSVRGFAPSDDESPEATQQSTKADEKVPELPQGTRDPEPRRNRRVRISRT